MLEDSFRNMIDAARVRINAEVDGQLTTLLEQHATVTTQARDRAAAEADGRWSAQLDKRNAEVQREMEAALAGSVAVPFPGPLLAAFRAIDSAATVSDILRAVADAASELLPRATLFVVNGAQLDRWPFGAHPDHASVAGKSREVDPVVSDAMKTGRVVRDNGTSIAAPMLLEGTPVAVLYGASDGTPGASEQPLATLEAIARYGSAHLGS
ncbi:MAG: hypothetical protein H0W08_20415, partial [Acidobacteria bacterium]|nr:hypothetical protein [Acidobacteriota bacterium]